MDRTKKIEAVIESFTLIRQHFRSVTEGFSELSLSHSQWLALAVIGRSHGVTVGDLRTTLGISSSAASQLVNSLEKKKCVERVQHTTDGRVSVLALTPDTHKAFAAIRKQKLKEFGKLFASLNDGEFKHYIKLHTKLIKSIS